MKRTLILLLFLATALTAAGQKTKDFKVIATDNRGKKINNLKLYVLVKGAPELHYFDNKNHVIIPGVNETDTLHIVSGKGIYELPVAGMDSLHLVFNRKKLAGYTVESEPKKVNTGYELTPLEASPIDASIVSTDDIGYYRDLAHYMEGRVSGVQVIDRGGRKELMIRGVNSIMSGTSPLIIVNDAPVASFDIANSTISPRDVESITVLKDGTMYGSRGSNGVVLITTKGYKGMQ